MKSYSLAAVLICAVLSFPATAQYVAPSVPTGRAKICITTDARLRSGQKLILPPMTAFSDAGVSANDLRKPWSLSDTEAKATDASFVTSEEVSFSKERPCSEASVRMLIGPLSKVKEAKAADRHIWHMDDVLDYTLVKVRPPIELGELIDNIWVRAVLVSDAAHPYERPARSLSDADRMARCLKVANGVISVVGGTIKRQTNSVVMITHAAASEMSIGCSLRDPDLFVSWDGALPTKPTLALVVEASQYVTGASPENLKDGTVKCIREALKPSSQETAAVHLTGSKFECQAFQRDGGGGSITILRRFGDYPNRD
ncbi:hypothetical protein [Tardiphaga sp. 813_E8_N1_3]|uniref:hypothetical protein n=1 Tax=Tardiphaga sp. 813_E8_N1_3 TaxID=3240760 RepID=UPI003F25D140